MEVQLVYSATISLNQINLNRWISGKTARTHHQCWSTKLSVRSCTFWLLVKWQNFSSFRVPSNVDTRVLSSDKTLLKRLLPSPVFLPYFIFLSLASFYFNNHWSRTITATVSECQRIPSEPSENGEKKCSCWQVATYVATAPSDISNNIIREQGIALK